MANSSLIFDKVLFWTKSGARFQSIRHVEKASLNWIFLPGGPGLGSESLLDLTKILLSGRHHVTGNVWHLDLPGDGSNITPNIEESFKNWSSALVEAIERFPHVILVAHSTGGMYALSTPRLEPLLEGLVLLDSAPDAGWQVSFAKHIEKHPIPGIDKIQEKYQSHPSNETLKNLTLASATYLFSKKGLSKGKKMLEDLPYNYKTCQWSEKNFDQTYQANWIPKKIPTLILSGENDFLTPLDLFSQIKEFCQNNIRLKSIKNAGHFPWIDNPKDVAVAFHEYYNQILLS